MSDTGRRSVAYIYPFAFQYRNPFHEQLRAVLAADGIDYDFIYCADPHFDSPRGDLIAPDWATPTRCTSLKLRNTRVRYQHALRRALSKDLVIVQQENGLLLNYAVQALARLTGTKVAFLGHGRNFQARNRNSRAERFKRFWIDKVDWWFAYTAMSADVVARSGFPKQRITTFNNAIDTSVIHAERQALDPQAQARLRETLVGGSRNVGVYVGGLYPDKRLGFVVDAARQIRARIRDFQLLVIGGGQDAALVEAAAAQSNWIHYLGPRFGVEKTAYVSLAKVLLMPGAVGLSVLDAFAYGTPMVTTEFPYHGPEIGYLENGKNGLITADDLGTYVDAVTDILLRDDLYAALREGAIASSSIYTMDAMVQRFASGLRQALAQH